MLTTRNKPTAAYLRSMGVPAYDTNNILEGWETETKPEGLNPKIYCHPGPESSFLEKKLDNGQVTE